MGTTDPNAALPDYIQAPHVPDILAGTNSSVRLYTASTTSRADALPPEWAGHYVVLTALVDDVWWMLSTDSGAVVDYTLAAANDGAPSPQLGSRLLYGTSRPVVLQVPQDGALYIVRQSSSDDAALQIELA